MERSQEIRRDPSTTLGMTPSLSSRLSGAHGEISGDVSTTLDMTDRILLVYITPSGKGLKVVFRADVAKGNLIDNQHAMAKVLGVEVDESCKDASRMSFICKESDILFINKELFTYENKAFSERYTALYRDGHSQATNEDDGSSSRPRSSFARSLPKGRENGVSGEISPCASLSRDDKGKSR